MQPLMRVEIGSATPKGVRGHWSEEQLYKVRRTIEKFDRFLQLIAPFPIINRNYDTVGDVLLLFCVSCTNKARSLIGI